MVSEYPALVINYNLSEYYKNIASSAVVINIVTNVSELRVFIRKYTNVISSIPIVVGDVADVRNHLSILLKFVEECQSPLIVLSSLDCMSRVLLSRFNSIVKIPRIVNSSRDDSSLLKDRFEKVPESLDSYVPMEDIIRYSPSSYIPLEIIKQSDFPTKHKIRSILF